MTKTPDTHKLHTLVLARLSARARKSPTPGQVVDSLHPYLEHAFTRAEQRELIATALDELARSGHITQRPLRLTDAGRERLRQALGVDRDVEWRTIKEQLLVLQALALPPNEPVRRRIARAEGLRGAILRQRHGLVTREAAPTLGQAVDALVWRALGVETADPLSLDRIRQHVLRHMLGVERQISKDRLLQLLAARAAAVERADTAALRVGLLRSWLFRAGAGASVPAARSAPVQAAPAPDLDEFVRQVHDAAQIVAADGRFGEQRVFISALWRIMRDVALCRGMSERDFKRCLIEANRRDLLRLHRADLVGSMPAHEVAASETQCMNSVFHFVEPPPRSRGA